MKVIKCELCGSNEFKKVGDEYECQYCHTKYGVEEAKKMMIEGTVDVSGSTVKVDNSVELENLYQVARRARDDNNSENAAKYYYMILIKDPSSWEATFYTVYYQSMNCKIAQIQSAGIAISNCEDTVLKLIKDNVLDEKDKDKAINEVASRLMIISNMLYNGATNHYNDIDFNIQANYTQEYINNCCAARDIMYNFGDYLINIFGDKYGIDVAVPCWKLGIEQHAKLMPKFANKQVNKDVIDKYAEKIKKYDSSYQEPTVSTVSGGCYVATCVYGSYDCPEVWTLRRFRDNYLDKRTLGRAFIKIYYFISPKVVRIFDNNKCFKKINKLILDKWVKKLNNDGYKNTRYNDKY